MSKYFDKLVKMNESIEGSTSGFKNNFEYALSNNTDMSEADRLISAFESWRKANNESGECSLTQFAKWLVSKPDEELYSEDDNVDKIEVPVDSLSDDQKKDILKTNGVDDKVVDSMKNDELDSAMTATLNNNVLKNESEEDKPDSGTFVIKMDDEDLGMVGYVESYEDLTVTLTEIKEEAKRYTSMDSAENEIYKICEECHYDRETLWVESDDDVNNEVNIDDSDIWVSLDPLNPNATTVG